MLPLGIVHEIDSGDWIPKTLSYTVTFELVDSFFSENCLLSSLSMLLNDFHNNPYLVVKFISLGLEGYQNIRSYRILLSSLYFKKN